MDPTELENQETITPSTEDELDLDLEDQDEPETPAKKTSPDDSAARLEKILKEREDAWKNQESTLKSELHAARSKEQTFRENMKKALLGEDAPQDPKKRAELAAWKEKVKQDFFEVFPEMQTMLQQQNAQEPTFAEKQFYASSLKTVQAAATERGFTDPVQQDLLAIIGDAIIHKNPELYKRYYKDGDSSVIDTVIKFMDDRFIAPFKAHVRKEVYAELRRTGRASFPDPGAGSNTVERKKAAIAKKYGDLGKPENNERFYDDLYSRAKEAAESE